MLIAMSDFKADIYNIIENILKTGQSVDIEHMGGKVRVSPVEKAKGKLDQLIPRPEAIVGLPEDFTHMDWNKK